MQNSQVSTFLNTHSKCPKLAASQAKQAQNSD